MEDKNMSKIMTVEEALASMKGKENEKGEVVINRFNKKNFNTLMVAMANDINFKNELAKVKKGELDEVEDIMVTKGFRKWCKQLVENAGVDKAESERIMSEDFKIDNMDGLYEFFATAIYKYMEAGNRFDFIPTPVFKGGIYIKDVEEKSKEQDAFSPKDRTYLGRYKTTKKKHKELGMKSGCPSFLQERIKVK